MTTFLHMPFVACLLSINIQACLIQMLSRRIDKCTIKIPFPPIKEAIEAFPEDCNKPVKTPAASHLIEVNEVTDICRLSLPSL